MTLRHILRALPLSESLVQSEKVVIAQEFVATQNIRFGCNICMSLVGQKN